MERLRILAAAVALVEFTATELAAYAGTSVNTVRSVLRRDARLFSPVGSQAVHVGGVTGRPPRRIRVVDQAAIGREIGALEREIADIARPELSGVSSERDEAADRLAAVSVAVNAVSRAWRSTDPGVRRIVSETALHAVERSESAAEATDVEDPVERRASAVATLARLTLAEATGERISLDQLWSAAQAATELLPDMQRLARWGLFRGLSRLAKAAHVLPPIGVLTSEGSSPADAFADLDSSSWTAHASHWSGHRLWSQRWTESLFGQGLVSCLVLYDEGDDDMLDTYMHKFTSGEYPTIVVSSRFSPSVVRKVTAAGAVFLPPDSDEADLADAIMNNQFLQTITASADNSQARPDVNTWQSLIAPVGVVPA